MHNLQTCCIISAPRRWTKWSSWQSLRHHSCGACLAAAAAYIRGLPQSWEPSVHGNKAAKIAGRNNLHSAASSALTHARNNLFFSPSLSISRQWWPDEDRGGWGSSCNKWPLLEVENNTSNKKEREWTFMYDYRWAPEAPARPIPPKDSVCFQGMKKKKKKLSAIPITSTPGTDVQEAPLQSSLGRGWLQISNE